MYANGPGWYKPQYAALVQNILSKGGGKGRHCVIIIAMMTPHFYL